MADGEHGRGKRKTATATRAAARRANEVVKAAMGERGGGGSGRGKTVVKKEEGEEESGGREAKRRKNGGTARKRRESGDGGGGGGDEEADDGVYCICRGRYDERPMIQCEVKGCGEWYHFECLGLSADDTKKILYFACPKCETNGRHKSDLIGALDKSEAKLEKKGKASTEFLPSDDEPLVESEVSDSGDDYQDEHRVKEEDPGDEDGELEDDGDGDDDDDDDEKGKGKSARQDSRPAERPVKRSRTTSTSKLQTSPSLARPTMPPPASPSSDRSRQKSKTPVKKSGTSRLSDAASASASASASATASAEDDPTRRHVLGAFVDLFIDIFLKHEHGENKVQETSSAEESAQSYARRVESAMFTQLHMMSPKNIPMPGPRYKEKFRSLAFNLKDANNHAIRAQIGSGQLEPTHLINMTSAQLANPEVQAMTENLRKESLAFHVLKPKENEAILHIPRKGEEIMEHARSKTPEPVILRRSSGPAGSLAPESESDLRERTTTTTPGLDSLISPEQIDLGETISSATLASGAKEISPPPLTKLVAMDRPVSDHSLSAATTMQDDSVAPEDTRRSPVTPVREIGLNEAEIARAAEAEAAADDNASQEDVDIDALLRETAPPADDTAGALQAPPPHQAQSEPPAPRPEIPVKPPSPSTSRRSSSGESTVRLPTAWRGRFDLPEVAKFFARAVQVGGTESSDWSRFITVQKVIIEGRIDVGVANKFILEQRWSTVREIAVLQLFPNESDGDRSSYRRLFDHLLNRSRYGVCGVRNSAIHDCYLVPLRMQDPLPEWLEVVDNLRVRAEGRSEDTFLAVCVMIRGFLKPKAPSALPSTTSAPVKSASVPPTTTTAPSAQPKPSLEKPIPTPADIFLSSLGVPTAGGVILPNSKPSAGSSSNTTPANNLPIGIPDLSKLSAIDDLLKNSPDLVQKLLNQNITPTSAPTDFGALASLIPAARPPAARPVNPALDASVNNMIHPDRLRALQGQTNAYQTNNPRRSRGGAPDYDFDVDPTLRLRGGAPDHLTFQMTRQGPGRGASTLQGRRTRPGGQGGADSDTSDEENGTITGAPRAGLRRGDELLVGFDDEGTLEQVDKPKGPLVIPALKNKDWRAEKRRDRAIYLPKAQEATPQVATESKDQINSEPQPAGLQLSVPRVASPTPGAPIEAADLPIPESDEARALRALNEGHELGTTARVHLIEQQALGSERKWYEQAKGETLAFRRDIVSLPDEASLEAYEAVPIEDFGKAMLRGMGWKEGTATTGNALGQAKVVEKRPALLGIGAKPKIDPGLSDRRKLAGPNFKISRPPAVTEKYIPVVRQVRERQDVDSRHEYHRSERRHDSTTFEAERVHRSSREGHERERRERRSDYDERRARDDERHRHYRRGDR